MGYRLNRLDEPIFMAGPKPMRTEFGIHQRLESWAYLLKTWHFSCCLDQYPKILYSSRQRHPLAPSQLRLAPAPSAPSSLVGSRVCQCCGPYLPFHSRYQQPEVVHLERSKNFLWLLHNHCWDIRGTLEVLLLSRHLKICWRATDFCFRNVIGKPDL